MGTKGSTNPSFSIWYKPGYQLYGGSAVQAFSIERWGDGESIDTLKSSAHCIEASLPGICRGLTKHTQCSPRSYHFSSIPHNIAAQPLPLLTAGEEEAALLRDGCELKGHGAHLAAKRGGLTLCISPGKAMPEAR